MSCSRLFGLLLALFLGVAAIEGGLVKKRSTGLFENEIAPQQSHHDMTSRLILRLIDEAITDAEDRGVDNEVVTDLIRKRSGIRKCFFHAVNCW